MALLFPLLAIATLRVGAHTRMEEALVDRLPDSAGARTDLLLIASDTLCPTDTEHVETLAFALQEAKFRKVVEGKTANDVRDLAARVSAAEKQERTSMGTLPPGSQKERIIRKTVEEYYEAAIPDGAKSYAPLFRFWTAERIAFAKQVQGARGRVDVALGFAEPEHVRHAAGYLDAQFLRTLKVSAIVANEHKAYVSLGGESVEMRGFYLLLEEGQWKVHADLFGYPWSREDSLPPECVGVLSEQ